MSVKKKRRADLSFFERLGAFVTKMSPTYFTNFEQISVTAVSAIPIEATIAAAAGGAINTTTALAAAATAPVIPTTRLKVFFDILLPPYFNLIIRAVTGRPLSTHKE